MTEPEIAADQIDIFAIRRVVEEVTDPKVELTVEQARAFDPNAEAGSEIRIPKGTESLGRISAQTAKQVILQRIRERSPDRHESQPHGCALIGSGSLSRWPASRSRG